MFLLPFYLYFVDNNETIAQSVARAKQNISGNGKRIVFFVGDPAMRLPLPKPRVQLSTINDIPIGQFTDTLQALGKYKFKGQILNANNQRLQEYNGNLSAIVFDKRIDRQTLGNDGARRNGELAIMDFTTLGENLFRGQASVVNGEFEFEFVLPKDTRLPVDNGRVSLYSSRENQLEEYSGFDTDILIGGLNEDAPEDNQGPLINLYMNDENFVNGGITDNQPFIFALLEDENGINTAGGIGHDIIAILDGDESNPIILNEYYEAEQDDFTNGKVYYRLRDLEDGEHTLSFKAWDVYNNSQTQDIQFVVAGEDELKITRVLNYPNPFIDYTEFWFNHNRPFEPLEVMVQVFTVTGKLVWTQNQIANTNGFLFRDLSWNGRDDFGDKIGKGVYVYKLTVKSTLTQQKVEKYENLSFFKLYIFVNSKLHMKSIPLFLIAVLYFSNSLQAQDDRRVITTGVPFLLIAADARSSGMGDQGVATRVDGFSQQWNPAKFAFSETKTGIGLSYTPYLRELVSDINLANLSYFTRINEFSAVAASIRYFGLGGVEFRDTAEQLAREVEPNEFAIDLSYSLRLSEQFSMAVTGRFINSNLRFPTGIADASAASSFGADVSMFYRGEEKFYKDFNGRWRGGLAISNIGPKIKYDDAGDENFLPTNFKAGAGFDFILDASNTIGIHLEINKLLVPTPPRIVRDEQGRISPESQQALLDYRRENEFGAIFSSWEMLLMGFQKNFEKSLGL